MSKDFIRAMKQQAIDFKSAQENAGRGGVPPGKYQMEITEAFVEQGTKGASAGKWRACFVFKVISGKRKGQQHRKYQQLETTDKTGRPVGLSILIQDLKTMGIECNGWAELVSGLEEAVGAQVNVTVARQESGGYVNTFINDRIDSGNDDDEEDEDEDEDEDTDVDLEDEEEEVEEEVEEEPVKRKRGRPKGSKNKPKVAAAAPAKRGPGRPRKVQTEDEEEFESLFED